MNVDHQRVIGDAPAWLRPPQTGARRDVFRVGRPVGHEPFALVLPNDLIKAETACLKQLVDVHDQVRGNVAGVIGA